MKKKTKKSITKSKTVSTKQLKNSIYHRPINFQDIMYDECPFDWLPDDYQFYEDGPHVCCLKNAILSEIDPPFVAVGITKYEGEFTIALLRQSIFGLCLLLYKFIDGVTAFTCAPLYRKVERNVILEEIGESCREAGHIVVSVLLYEKEVLKIFNPLLYNRIKHTCGHLTPEELIAHLNGN